MYIRLARISGYTGTNNRKLKANASVNIAQDEIFCQQVIDAYFCQSEYERIMQYSLLAWPRQVNRGSYEKLRSMYHSMWSTWKNNLRAVANYSSPLYRSRANCNSLKFRWSIVRNVFLVTVDAYPKWLKFTIMYLINCNYRKYSPNLGYLKW